MNAKKNERTFGILRIAWMAIAALTLTTAAAHAQAGRDGPTALSVSILHLNISNLERSLAFYRDVLGMQVIRAPGEPRAMPALVKTPGARLSTAVVGVPGGKFQMELVQWTGVPVKPQQPRIQDPGEVMLAMTVKDMDSLITGARNLGLEVLTAGGKPYTVERKDGTLSSIMVRDRDGFIVELNERSGPAAAETAGMPGPVTGVSVYLTVEDLAGTVTFYNRVFGFDMPTPGAPQATPKRIQALFDNNMLKTVRMARGTFPGSDFALNFQEFGGVDRKPVHHRVQDPGGPVLLVTVDDFSAAVERIKANGGTIGTGDKSATLEQDARNSWVRDPNGLLINLSASQPSN